VALKVVIRGADNQYGLDGIAQADYQAFNVAGPLGSDSGGLPLRCYVRRGTRHERALNNAKAYSSGRPEESYVVKGVARGNRQMVVEVIEKE